MRNQPIKMIGFFCLNKTHFLSSLLLISKLIVTGTGFGIKVINL